MTKTTAVFFTVYLSLAGAEATAHAGHSEQSWLAHGLDHALLPLVITAILFAGGRLLLRKFRHNPKRFD